jgi:hypothetical protein
MMNNAVLMVIRGLACIALIFAGGVIATEVNAIIGCLVSATGLIALAAPLIIECDGVVENRNRKYREEQLRQAWEINNGK